MGFNQFATLGFFIKDIEKPIEEVVNESGDLVITSFQNVPAAELRGFEIEYEEYLIAYYLTWIGQKQRISYKNEFYSNRIWSCVRSRWCLY